jgi:hypothetical protein
MNKQGSEHFAPGADADAPPAGPKRRRHMRWSDPVPLCMVVATILGSGIVSWILGDIGFFAVITGPLVVTVLITLWFRSWVPVLVVAISYLYFMFFWLAGTLGNLVDRTFAQSFAEVIGIDNAWARFASYIGVWALFVLAGEVGLNRLTGKNERDPTVPLPLQ